MLFSTAVLACLSTVSAQGEMFQSSAPPVVYNGGRVLTGDVNVYLVYYGKWSAARKTVVESFLNNVAESDWYRPMKALYSQDATTRKKTFINGKIRVAGVTSDPTKARGSNFVWGDVPSLITSYIDKKTFPLDPNGIYFLLGDETISESFNPAFGPTSDPAGGPAKFCTDYCGYHVAHRIPKSAAAPQTDIFYSFVALPSDSCFQTGCSAYDSVLDITYNNVTSPNNDVHLDSAMSVIAHELIEAISDPYSNQKMYPDQKYGWGYIKTDGSYFPEENADQCAYVFPNAKTDARGVTTNAKVGPLSFLLQANYLASKNACV
ncbi:hypothetical protein HDV03_001079 [Kappamyces sp. JEL0829]|nr:hypothetical protein HDV03_001079 [Kappamyces sp. JEL0829]